MARDLDTDMQTLNAVLTFAQNRDFERAAALAEKTLASGFEHPLLFNVVATRLENEGRFEDALPLLERAVSMAPADVAARNALSLCLQRLDRPGDALHHLEQLLKKHPDLGFAHANKGNALMALGALGAAQISHSRALQLQPDNVAAMAALAAIAARRGDHGEARVWAERALAASPGLPSAVMSLAAAELASGALDRAETLLQQLILGARAEPSDRARATGLLGDVLDAAGRYAEAFDAYSTCNEALRHSHRRLVQGTSVVDLTRGLTTAITQFGPHRWSTSPVPEATSSDALEHVFLLSFPCSGTALLEDLLEGHPQAACVDAHELLTEAAAQFLRQPLDLAPLVAADERQLGVLRSSYWDGVRNAGIDTVGKVFIDKHPLNTLKLPLIARLFPHAKILFGCRDPRAVVLSCFSRRFRMDPATYELLTLPGAAGFYHAVMAFAQLARPLMELRWRDVRYESLTTDMTPQARAIFHFVGLEWVASMDDVASRLQARNRERSETERWRHYEAALQSIQPTLKLWVERLGYAV